MSLLWEIICHGFEHLRSSLFTPICQLFPESPAPFLNQAENEESASALPSSGRGLPNNCQDICDTVYTLSIHYPQRPIATLVLVK